MDWFSWLSKTSLDPSLSYEYGLAFARNELQAEDLAYFNHEFLQSMGISVAKHRLEILKLVRKEVGAGPNSLSKFILAITKTKKNIKKCISKLVFHEDSAVKALPELEHYHGQWSGALTRKVEQQQQQPPPATLKTRRQAKSGPLDRMVLQDHLLLASNNYKSLKFSGPLDGKVQERLVFAYRSPKICGSTPDGRVQQQRLMVASRSPQVTRLPLDGRCPSPKVCSQNKKEKVVTSDFDDHSLWAALFQDMKPT